MMFDQIQGIANRFYSEIGEAPTELKVNPKDVELLERAVEEARRYRGPLASPLKICGLVVTPQASVPRGKVLFCSPHSLWEESINFEGPTDA